MSDGMRLTDEQLTAIAKAHIYKDRDALNDRISKMRPYNGRSMSVQEHDELMDKVCDERDALAIVIQKLRDGVTTCIAYKATPSIELLKIGYDLSAEIINRHDAEVLRKAAVWFATFGEDRDSAPDIAAAQQLDRMAAELEVK